MSPLKRYPRSEPATEGAESARPAFAPAIEPLAGDARVATVALGGAVLAEVRDALDLVGTAAFSGVELIVLAVDQLAPEFFDLKSGLAGEVIQKFVNYRVRLAIVGEIGGDVSEALRAFIVESNRGRHVAFVTDLQSALAALGPGGAS